MPTIFCTRPRESAQPVVGKRAKGPAGIGTAACVRVDHVITHRTSTSASTRTFGSIISAFAEYVLLAAVTDPVPFSAQITKIQACTAPYLTRFRCVLI